MAFAYRIKAWKSMRIPSYEQRASEVLVAGGGSNNPYSAVPGNVEDSFVNIEEPICRGGCDDRHF
jgi:hypothetical protein